MSISRIGRRAAWAVGGLLAVSFACLAEPYEDAAIQYAVSPAHDAVTRLQARIDKGEVRLAWDEKFGYLPSLLKELEIPESSQMLVFSKTSFQRTRISPRHPRALYFRDDVYVGYVQGGEVLEVSAADPRLGAVFYTLPQKPEKPRLSRMGDDCMICHESNLTDNVPGHIVRSVLPDLHGQPILSAGTTRVNHSTPLKDRWGGWYVTGRSGSQVHMGNAIVDEDRPQDLDRPQGSNLLSLQGRLDTSQYLRPTSDIVALMVLEHQTQMQNLITKAGYGVRMAERDEKIMNEALGRPANYVSESTPGRIKGACEPLVRYMLFTDEAKLTARIEGVSVFAEEFAKRGPADGQGRSLRQFDLETRLFKYPCSYLVYSEAFDGLPDRAKTYIYRRLWEILTGQDRSKEFVGLADDSRKAILEILRDTKRDLPDYWRQ